METECPHEHAEDAEGEANNVNDWTVDGEVCFGCHSVQGDGKDHACGQGSSLKNNFGLGPYTYTTDNPGLGKGHDKEPHIVVWHRLVHAEARKRTH